MGDSDKIKVEVSLPSDLTAALNIDEESVVIKTLSVTKDCSFLAEIVNKMVPSIPVEFMEFELKDGVRMMEQVALQEYIKDYEEK